MVAFVLPLVLAAAFPLSSSAVPLQGFTTTASFKGVPVFPPINYGLMCRLPIPGVKQLCAIGSSSGAQVRTPLGTANGVLDTAGANRFAVKYASAGRWAESTVVTQWALPNGGTNASALPLACPQPLADPSGYAEDCLSMILYVPTNCKAMGGVPTLLWIHGGSFISGSATAPGLSGSKLAIATNSIVAVMQYRLGALGFMAPDGKTNLAVKDTINAMKFLAKVVPSFGGNGKITVAGQSSGAGMIRALLAAPSASSLFQSAILQSDPINYGFLNASTQVKLQSTFNGLTGCAATNTACQKSLSLDAIIDAQVTLGNQATSIDASTGSAEPVRPVRDGTLINTPLDLTAPFPAVDKPILLSNVKNEAGPTIYGIFKSSITREYFAPVCDQSLGPERTAIVQASPFYNLSASSDTRIPLETLGTDYMWRCPTWSLARSWAGRGGKAFVGLYVTGATYPANSGTAFCLQSGSVCHQDDIEIVFGTVPSPTAAQAALTIEMQARYKAFLTTGSPNAPGLSVWSAATTSSVHAHQLGGTPSPSGEVPVGACDPSFWGQGVLYDYQVFGI
ncbi:alpha/beta-hydrolase [Mycena belliarum]|uniref:Alpha/beta-hydrolase n=1 Tax=Mycena belliarum TaxID=1033014 RepID=A0AAD6U2N0_9AGAR|nr:alpha/beta-hydrolase [Mycena belliae]